MRVKITFAYDGTNYYGSQVQSQNPNTVNGVLEHVLKKIKIDSKVVASGRTDRGVHATMQVAHIDLPPYWSDVGKLKSTLNRMLPQSISIKSIMRVDDSFHARYSAKQRVYRYIIKPSKPSVFEANYVTYAPDVDFKKIQSDISLFCGTYDFKAFSKSGSDTSTTTRTIYKAFCYRHRGYIVLHFCANGFLRSQIRLMVAALLNRSSDDIIDMLKNAKRTKLKPANHNGLYLARIKY